MTYNYDLAGDVNSWTHPAGFTITNSINGAQRVAQITSSLNDATHPGTLATISYTPWGAEQTLENGCAGSGCTNTLETYAYNNRLQAVMIELGTTGNASADYCLVYNYYSSLGSPGSCATPSQGTGNNGNVMGYFYQDNVNSGLSHTTAYTYDSLNRLTNAVATGNSTYDLPFSYTADGSDGRYGNVTCVINQSTSGTCPTYTFNQANNQITNTGYTYDAAGDLTSDGTYSYQWDAEGRLVSLNGGSAASGVYNALNDQVRSSVPGSGYTWDVLFDPAGHWTARYDGGWQVGGVFHFGSRLFGIYTDQFYGIHVNVLGTEATNTNAVGNESGDTIFYPWGEVWGGGSQAWEYAAFEYANFPYLLPTRFRQYDPGKGRWLSPDPSNAGADTANPQTWNAYSYAGNNPTTNTDPSGLSYCQEDSNGNIDQSSCVSDKDYQSLGTNVPGYVQVSHDVSVTVNGNDTTPEDYQAALVAGVHQAAPTVNATFQALRAFGYLVALPVMAAAECLAGAPGCTKANVALSLVPGGKVFDDSEPALLKLAKEFNLNLSSPGTRDVLKNLDTTVDMYITRFRQASVRAEVPGEFLNQTVREALESGNSKVRKLLVNARFAK